jgi:lysozyme
MSSSLLSTVESDLIRHEGRRSKVYRDTKGFLTVGVGHNLDAEGLCDEAIAVQLAYDIRTKAIEPLNRYLPWWDQQPDSVKRALINLMFNMGPRTLLQFQETLSLMKKGDYREAAAQLLKSRYATQVGQRAQEVASWIASAESSPGG